jgi:hydrogenase/urease accessory protein HupE
MNSAQQIKGKDLPIPESFILRVLTFIGLVLVLSVDPEMIWPSLLGGLLLSIPLIQRGLQYARTQKH